MSYQSFEQVLQKCHTEEKEFWRVILEDDMAERNVSEEDSMEHMRVTWDAMLLAAATYEGNLNSSSGLVGGDGRRMEEYIHSAVTESLCGEDVDTCIAGALQMGESNACMKRIVAAPTAGSCGVIPAVLLSYEEEKQVPEERLVEALFVAAGIGEVLANSASISGAEGGCQAEIGSASAMAAGAVTYLEGGDSQSIVHAAALALKNMLGLTCDPVGGLVEVPCIKRNVSGAVNAITSSQLALAGIKSAIEPDEVIDSMRRIGKLIPECLKETAKEGLAITPSALRAIKISS